MLLWQCNISKHFPSNRKRYGYLSVDINFYCCKIISLSHWSLPLLGNKPKKFDFVHQTVSHCTRYWKLFVLIEQVSTFCLLHWVFHCREVDEALMSLQGLVSMRSVIRSRCLVCRHEQSMNHFSLKKIGLDIMRRTRLVVSPKKSAVNYTKSTAVLQVESLYSSATQLLTVLWMCKIHTQLYSNRTQDTWLVQPVFC